MSNQPSPSTSAASVPIPASYFPSSLAATPDMKDTSSKVPSFLLMKSEFGQVSLATKTSVQPSLLKSARTTPMPFTSGIPSARFLADIGKRAVVIIVVKLQPQPAIVIRMAVGAVAGPVLAAIEVVLGRPVDVVADQQVEISVLVVIKPAGAGGPLAFVGDAGLGGHVRESAVAVVVVKDGRGRSR